MERTTGRTIIAGVLFIAALVFFGYGTSYAKSNYLSNFRTAYPAAVGTAIDTCTLCHTSTSGSAPRNPYGSAYGSNSHSFTAIKNLDSDGDTFSNIKEIKDLSFPGNPASKPVKPVVTAFAIPAKSSSLVVTITTFTATDNVKVSGYKLTETSTKPTASSAGWTATKPANYTFLTAGIKTLYAWAKDAAGLVSASKRRSVTITLPVAPAAAGPAGAPGAVQAQATASAAGSLMPLPAGQEVFTYDTAVTPVRSDDPASTIPVGVSPSGAGGGTIDMQVSIGKFEGPVNVYLTLYAPAEKPSFAPVDVYSLQPDNTFKPVDMGQAGTAGVDPWKTNVNEVNETVLSSMSQAGLPAGQYLVVLTVTNANNENVYYEWMTHFIVTVSFPVSFARGRGFFPLPLFIQEHGRCAEIKVE